MAAKRGKSQARRSGGNDNTLPGWAWLVLGVLLTMVVIIVAPKYLKSDGDGFFRPQPNPDAQPAPIAQDEEPVAPEGDTAAPKIAKQAEKQGEDYDFYTLLPGKEVPLSDAEIAATERAEAQREAARLKQQQALSTAQNQPQPAADTAADALPAPIDDQDTTSSPAKPTTTTSTTTAATTGTTRPAATTQTTAATKPAATVAQTGAARVIDDNMRYLLQAGAFQASGQAEELKAKIALLGLGARVEAAEIKGTTVYRVRMGPYGTAGDLAEAKRKLAAGGLQAMAIKVK